MTKIQKSIKVPYTPAEMFNLVDAIEHYPAFLPGCLKTIVHTRTSDEVRASIVVSKRGIQYSFTTHNHLQTAERIEMRLEEGPFRHLEGVWQFVPLALGCQVELALEFEFKNRWMTLAAGPVVDRIAQVCVGAFCERARVLYGR